MRAWIVVLVAALAVPATAVAQESVAAWCGASYGAAGTNFGECVSVEREVQVAGESGGLKTQTVSVPTHPEYPSAMVTIEDGKAFFNTQDKDGETVQQELHLHWAAAPSSAVEMQLGGGEE